jgi:tyrosine-protein phosphatase non-receptor type 23
VKQKYFLSLAQYHHALADVQSEEVGHALARLNIAESTAREAQKLVPYLGAYTTTLPSDSSSIFSETIKSYISIVAELKTTTQRDNDFIFHKLIPNEPQLPAIGKLSLAKPTSLTELYKADDVQKIIGTDLFAKLIPMSVTQSASMYSEEKAKLLRAEQEKSDIADGELVAALDHLQLPGSLKRFTESKDEVLTELRKPSQTVKDIAREVAAGERSERTANLVAKLQQLRTKARDGIQNALRQLDEEERECQSMKAKYGSDWTQAPSAGLTGSLRQELNSNKDTLEQAKSNDDLLEAQWMRYRSDIEILASGEDGLPLREEFKRIGTKPAAPTEGSLLDLVDDDTSAGSMGRVAEHVQTVERGLSGLNVIKRERQTTLKQLKEAAHNDDISSVLILNKKNPNIESQLFTSELEKFRPYQTRLGGLVHKQQDLLSEVVKAFKALLQEQAGSKEQEEIEAAQQEADNYIARFRAARGGWEDVREGAQ